MGMEKSAMNQMQRITHMEKNLDNAREIVSACTEALEQLERLLKQYEACLPKIEELLQYYGSTEWFADKEDSDSGRLPADLKCGVLSEDAVYNFWTDYDALRERMEELGKRIIKSR